MKAHLVAALFASLCATSAHADELTELGQVGVKVMKTSPSHVKEGICFAPLAATLVDDPSTLRCAVTGSDTPPVVPAFRRMHDGLAADWAIDVAAALNRSAWRGNAVFTFFDAGDASAMDEDRYTAMYQADIAKAKELHAHVHLSPASGFQQGHTYRMRIAQLIRGAEVVLAEGDVRLE
jgi:hypothetical protein